MIHRNNATIHNAFINNKIKLYSQIKSLGLRSPVPAPQSTSAVLNAGDGTEVVQPESTEKAEVESESSEDDTEEEEDEPDGWFYLTRTPPHAFRFRTLLDGPGPAPCWGAWPLWRKRWAFATEAVLYETRLRMWSKKAVGAAIAERRRWIYHSIRYDLTDSSITPNCRRFDSFTIKEWEVYDAMMTTVDPNMARIWEETAHFMARRQTYIVGRLFCDLCTKLIAFCRYQCIMCMKDDLSTSIDLCQNCFDKPEGVLRNASQKYAHVSSHSLLRSRNRVHSYEINSLIPAARLTSERCKKMFRELENAKKDKIAGHPEDCEGQGFKKGGSR
ncbi:hypothetical protein BJ912DRAFT_352585 [Pholiota molesta]|nr:hypothetical protein BJ912DRAFT_352585 [Pholiota molesta]